MFIYLYYLVILKWRCYYMWTCEKCMKVTGVIFLVLGILFLLRDVKVWDFWNIQWWTALFVVVGITALASGGCPDCQVVRNGKKK